MTNYRLVNTNRTQVSMNKATIFVGIIYIYISIDETVLFCNQES